MAARDVDIDLVHGDVLRITAVRVLLHLWVVVLHDLSPNVERERSSLLDMVQEVPRGRLVSILLFSKPLHFCRLEHVVELVVVWIFAALVVVHLEHA